MKIKKQDLIVFRKNLWSKSCETQFYKLQEIHVGLFRRPRDPLNLTNPPASDPPPLDPKTPAVGRGFRQS